MSRCRHCHRTLACPARNEAFHRHLVREDSRVSNRSIVVAGLAFATLVIVTGLLEGLLGGAR